MTTRITIRKPDDWHLHVRDGAMLKAVLPFTAKHFGRAILMPNLMPPVRTTAEAIAYRERVMAALPPGAKFKPLMTCYLTDDTDPDDVERGFRDGVFTGVKLYPANATTNSAAGVTDLQQSHARAGAHGEDRHAVPDARRGGRSGRRHFRPREGVHRAASDEMGQAVSRPAHDPRASVVQGRRRFRAQRRAAGRRHHHALSHDAHPHRLARPRAQALHVCACR